MVVQLGITDFSLTFCLSLPNNLLVPMLFSWVELKELLESTIIRVRNPSGIPGKLLKKFNFGINSWEIP